MAIQVRRGPIEEFDPNSLLPGEWACVLDQKDIYICFGNGQVKKLATYEEIEALANSAGASASVASTKAGEASTSAENANTKAGEANESSNLSASKATESQSWANGGTNTREGEDTNNAHYWCNQAQYASQGVTDYDQLSGRPQIGGVTLTGNKQLKDLGCDITFNSASDNPATSTAIAAWVQGQIANGSLRKEIVATLPTTDINTNIIYMILKETASEDDIYNEYLNMDGTTSGWEFIGSSSVDLTNYYTKTESNNSFALKAQTGDNTNLNTTEKGTLVGAICEVNENLANGCVKFQVAGGKLQYSVYTA